MKAPFPYFGGKATVASQVWAALGQPKHYIEPFFGSGAVLLNRPMFDATQYIETVCDKDGFVTNVWRALQQDPDEVARWCDWPVNHADLSARKRRLIAEEAHLLEHLIADEAWYDAKLAGYWIWMASCWIGSGLTLLGQRPHIGNGGKGVHALGQKPHVSHSGVGVHALGQRPHVSHSGVGVQEPYNPNIYQWFRVLSERLRYVRVVCGDWTRVCGGNWQDNQGVCGIFFDPPYGVTDRDQKIYHHESIEVSHEVRQWAIQRGKKQSYRIVLAGYTDEHDELADHGWVLHSWHAPGGYSSTAKQDNTQGKVNRKREVLWYSPHCIRMAHHQMELCAL